MDLRAKPQEEANQQNSYQPLPNQPFPNTYYPPPPVQNAYPQQFAQFQNPAYPNSQYPPQYPPQYPNPPNAQPYGYQNFPQPGYLPPPQYYNNYPNAGALPQNTNDAQTMQQIKDLDSSLSKGCYRWYLIWLYFMACVGIGDFIQTMIYMFNLDEFNLIGSAICAIFIIIQALIEAKAIRTKDQARADRALTFMVVYILLHLGWVAFVAVWYSDDIVPDCYYYDDYNYYYYWYHCFTLFDYVQAVLIINSSLLFVNLLITLVGAVKVRKMLKLRKSLQYKLNPSNYHLFTTR